MHHNKPFAASSPDDHRASVWVASFLCLTFVALGVGTRTWIRIRVFGIDDYVVLAAFVVALAQFCTVFGGLSTGLGKATDELSSKKAELAGQIFLASEALFVLTLYAVKNAVLFTFQRVLSVSMKKELLACRIFHGLLGLCAIISLLLVTVECSAGSLLTPHRQESCVAQTARWSAITAIDGLTEVAMFVAFCIFAWSLQMKRAMKMTLISLIAFRLGCIAFSIVRVTSIADYVSRSNSTNGGLAVVGPLVWQQVAIGYSFLSAVLMTLKGFLQSFDVSNGWGENAPYKSTTQVSGNGGINSGSFPLQDRSGAKNTPTYQANVRTANRDAKEDADDRSCGSGSSQRAIIRYATTFEVSSELR